MNKINWHVRFRNIDFWFTFVPACALLVQTFLALFDIEVNTTETTDRLLNLINTLFIVLTLLGVVNDPTTKSLSDSEQAMTYETPKK